MENNESVIILVVVGIAFVLLFGGYYLISKKEAHGKLIHLLLNYQPTITSAAM